MVHDALREMEEKGTSPEEPWMVGLKEAAGSAVMGTLLRYRMKIFANVSYLFDQPHQKLYVTLYPCQHCPLMIQNSPPRS